VSRVLGLDPSLTGTGMAALHYHNGRWVGITASRGRPGKRGESLEVRDRRQQEILEHLYGANLDGLDVAGVESPAFGAPGGSTWDRAGLWWRLVHSLIHHRVPVVQVTSGQRQKFAVGRAHSAKNPVDKADVAMAAAKMWPDIEIRGNNAADALVIASIAAVTLDLPVPFPMHGYRREVVETIEASASAA
jgi:Holliday junction resolvasome RuvABC endonuclease subunit